MLTILVLIDYGNFMIESGTISRVTRLEKLQLKAQINRQLCASNIYL